MVRKNPSLGGARPSLPSLGSQAPCAGAHAHAYFADNDVLPDGLPKACAARCPGPGGGGTERNREGVRGRSQRLPLTAQALKRSVGSLRDANHFHQFLGRVHTGRGGVCELRYLLQPGAP